MTFLLPLFAAFWKKIRLAMSTVLTPDFCGALVLVLFGISLDLE